jgi:hypothetical protein
LTVKSHGQPTRREQSGQWELLVPVTSGGNSAMIELDYDW